MKKTSVTIVTAACIACVAINAIVWLVINAGAWHKEPPQQG